MKWSLRGPWIYFFSFAGEENKDKVVNDCIGIIKLLLELKQNKYIDIVVCI